MQRSLFHDLKKWKEQTGRKPLVLQGVRQCGKTFLLKHFGESCFKDVAYFNFEGNPALHAHFEQDLNPERILMELGILRGKKIVPGETLVILDEIQFCNAALTALKYFCEQAPLLHISCAGSLLGISQSRPLSFPVGKVDFLTLRPLSFPEFLLANDQQMLLEHMQHQSQKEPLPQAFRDRLTTLYKLYLLIGGMPEAVAKWLATEDLSEVEKIQDALLSSYELDFAKHAPVSDFPKLNAIWKSIPNQLAGENGKFIYGHAKPGARAKDLEDALQWLINAGMVHAVHRVEKPGIPLSAYKNPSFFKLYLSDVGLLRKMAQVPASAMMGESQLFSEFKGALTENYVLCSLVDQLGQTPYYWKSGNTAEVDFVAQIADQILPIEVKSAVNTRSRSLSVYREKYKPALSIKTSMLPTKEEDGLLNLALYEFWQLRHLVSV